MVQVTLLTPLILSSLKPRKSSVPTVGVTPAGSAG